MDVTWFPSPAHLVSWAKFADRPQPRWQETWWRNRQGQSLAGPTLGELVAAVSRTDTFLGERYRRLARRRGKSRAIVAVGNSVLTIWHLLADPEARYHDLGADFYQSKINARRANAT